MREKTAIMNIAIVEDEASHSRLLEQYITAWGLSKKEIVHAFCYASAESFLFSLEDFHFDAVFADIQMPGMNGMDMIKKLRQKDGSIPVVFTTGLSDYLQEGYEVQALNYLIKPISEEKVAGCMDHVCSQCSRKDFYMMKSENGTLKVSLHEINYCEADGHYAVFAMTDKTQVRSISSLSDIERELSGKPFIKCHRSYLCNLENVKQITQDTVLFDNGDTVPLSRRSYRAVNQAFIAFYKELFRNNF